MINKLNREKYAWRYVIPRLNDLWTLMNSYVTYLRDSAEPVTTEHVINKRKALVEQNNNFKSFRTNFGTWFLIEYPDYSTALDGAILSIDNIAAYIAQMGENYKDAETGKYIMSDVTKADRNTLADQIETELE